GGKKPKKPPIGRGQTGRDRRDAEQAAAVIDHSPRPKQSHAAGGLQVDFQCVEEVLVGRCTLEDGLAEARIETADTEIASAHRAEPTYPRRSIAHCSDLPG